MVVLAAVENGLIALSALDERIRGLDAPADGALDLGRGRSLRLNNGSAEGDAAPFVPIGIGKPLTITLESVYVGNYPDAWRWNPLADVGDVLVTSAIKSFQAFDASPRAIHLLAPAAKRKSSLAFTAVNAGSKLVYYTRAATEKSLSVTIELSADRDFDAEIGTSLGTALVAAAGLPVFAPAAPYLVAAGTAVSLGPKAINLLARPQRFYSATDDLGFGRPGLPYAKEGAFVFAPDEGESGFEGYKLDKQFRLRKGGETYAGDLPYVVMSLDGTEHPEWKGWAAHAASAEIVKRFHEPGNQVTEAIGVVTEGLTLYNDVSFVRRAGEARKLAAKEKDPAKKKELEDLAAAYVKNVQSEVIKVTLK